MKKYIAILLTVLSFTSAFGQKIKNADWSTNPPDPSWTDDSIYIPNTGTYLIEFDQVCYVTEITVDRSTSPHLKIYSFVSDVGYVEITTDRQQVCWLNRWTRYLKIVYGGTEPINVLIELE